MFDITKNHRGATALVALGLLACSSSAKTQGAHSGGTMGDSGMTGLLNGDAGTTTDGRGGRAGNGGSQAKAGQAGEAPEAGASGDEGGAGRGGASQGGAGRGGASQGGAGRGGASQGGAGRGGASQGGAGQGGASKGGASHGGASQGGTTAAAHSSAGYGGESLGGGDAGGTTSGGSSQAAGGTVTGGTGSGGQAGACSDTEKLCNDTCILVSECCGGCSGDKPVCSYGTCVGKPLGESCSSGAECSSNICSDGVCCDMVCDGQCEACNTTANKGACSPTTTPRSPCTTDGTVCGGTCDGTPAHRDQCVYPNANTQCVAGRCDSGTNTQIYPRTCDSAGHCAEATTRACSPYTCQDATSCASGCPQGQDTCGGSSCVPLNTAAHCGNCSNVCSGTSAPFCAGGTTCVECTIDGNCSGKTPWCSGNKCVECTADSHCPGTGSSCNLSTHTCQCRQPSAGNLLSNPGFNGSVTPLWNAPTFVYDGTLITLATYDGAADADSCPNSGSVHLTYFLFAFGMVDQCVSVTPNTQYRFGYRFKQSNAEYDDSAMCTVTSYSGSGCAEAAYLDSAQYYSGPGSLTWANPTATMAYITAAGTGSVKVQCQATGSPEIWFDQIYLNATGAY